MHQYQKKKNFNPKILRVRMYASIPNCLIDMHRNTLKSLVMDFSYWGILECASFSQIPTDPTCYHACPYIDCLFTVLFLYSKQYISDYLVKVWFLKVIRLMLFRGCCKKKMPFENLSTFLRRLKLYLPWCNAFKHIARSANEKAHLLAK